MGRDDYCPEDARAFARWGALGRDCGHESECTPDGECIECLRLGDEDAAHADHEREYDKDEAWSRAQDDEMFTAWRDDGEE